MITRFFKFIALLWYADEHGWPSSPHPHRLNSAEAEGEKE